jgi:beta-phosphoglucomutase
MLKAVLFDFNGVIINDEPLHERLLDQILIEENLRPKPEDYWQFCVGRSDRACFTDLMTNRGRLVTDKYLQELIVRKSRAYQQQLAVIEKLPIYPGLADFIFQLRSAHIKMAVVSGAVRSEIDLVLDRAQLTQHFSAIVSADDITHSKPDPEGYLLAVKRLNQQFPDLSLQPHECLAIEDTFPGLQAAKQAGMQVVGVANTYPFHMMQRRSNWTVDFLSELELDRIKDVFAGKRYQPTVS